MISTSTLSNGLAVIVEEMPHVESVSYDLILPGGYVCDPVDRVGASVIVADLVGRGAGPLNSRELSNAFEDLGIRHGEGAGTDRFAFSGSLVSGSLDRALELVSFMVTEPHLPADEIENIQSVLLQDLDALKDNPARRAMVELTSRYYPAPYNRSSLGESEGIRKTDQGTCKAIVDECFGPAAGILSIAGRIEAAEAFSIAEKRFGGWRGKNVTIPKFHQLPANDYFHIPCESSQLQIALASPSVKFGEPDYYSGKIAISLLGASMFGRLFVEVREKRGLCYSVYARHGATASYGTVSAYVGTTPERAQESLDVLVREFSNLRGSVSQSELDRSKTNLKAALVMGEESPGSRAASNAGDWWLLKRVRSLQEINSLIDAVTIDSVDSYLSKYPFSPCSILTLGNRELEIPAGLVGGR